MGLQSAEHSPRICNDGSIRWYEGDTFRLIFEMSFTDEDDNPITIELDDEIKIVFCDRFEKVVQEFSVKGSNVIEMNFTEEISKKFKEGTYNYTTRLYHDGYIKTVMHENVVVVE